MKVSFKCITYGRNFLLEEALYSFLHQEVNDSELIIVNDYPLQEFIFEHPQVRIYNLKETFKTIGDKENFAVDKCSGELIALQDDDDIALPNHLNNIKKYWKDGANLMHWNRAIYFNKPNITAITGVGNSGIVYSKKVWEEIGGHPLENAGYDQTLCQRIRAKGGVLHAEPPDNEVSWLYRWGGGEYHMSGRGTDDGSMPNVIERNAEHVEYKRRLGLIPTGKIYLNPHWEVDYSELLCKFVENSKK